MSCALSYYVIMHKKMTRIGIIFWRHVRESNSSTRFCRPLRNRSANAPLRAIIAEYYSSRIVGQHKISVQVCNTPSTLSATHGYRNDTYDTKPILSEITRLTKHADSCLLYCLCLSGRLSYNNHMSKNISDTRVVVSSLLVSAADVVLNVLVAMLTGSAVMLSQSLQGLSDFTTSAILYKGTKQSRRTANDKYQFGFGRGFEQSWYRFASSQFFDPAAYFNPDHWKNIFYQPKRSCLHWLPAGSPIMVLH